MRDDPRRIARPADLIAVAVILAAAGILWAVFGSAEGARAEIIVGKETVETVDLTAVKEPYTIPLDNGVTVTVEPGAIYFSDSDCPNHLCMRAGKLTKAGQSAACIPNQTLIRVAGRARNAPDALTG